MLLGMEIEVRGLSPDFTPGGVKRFCRIDDDRSVRGYPITVDRAGTLGKCNLIPANPYTEKFFQKRVALDRGFRIGAELVTRPLPYEEARILGNMIAEHFKHVPFTPEASIHIHVGMINRPWIEVYKVLLLFLYLEQGYYHLAAGGQKHRGEHHRRRFELNPIYDDYRYCRPLSVPIAVRDASDADEVLPCINVPALLTAKSATDLLVAWGRLDQMRTVPHYLPHRLMGLNLCSMMRLGTLEWRIFDPRYELLPYFIDLVVDSHRLAAAMDVEQLRHLAYSGFWMARIQDYKITKEVFQDLFGNRPWLTKLWSNEPSLQGVTDHLLLSHYDGQQRWVLDTEAEVSTCKNNLGEVDDGSDSFILYKEAMNV